MNAKGNVIDVLSACGFTVLLKTTERIPHQKPGRSSLWVTAVDAGHQSVTLTPADASQPIDGIRELLRERGYDAMVRSDGSLGVPMFPIGRTGELRQS